MVVAALLLLFTGRLQAADPVELEAPLFINIGGDEYTDDFDNFWLADREYGSTTGYGFVDFINVESEPIGGPGVAVSGTVYDRSFGQAREGLDAYQVNLQNGKYDVKLYFAEVSGQTTAAGQRVLDVYIEGAKILDGYDIYDAVGPQAASSKLIQDVAVADGQLTIQFVTQLGLSVLSGVHVKLLEFDSPTPTPTPAATPTPTPRPSPVTFLNTGGGRHVDADGNVWEADRPFSSAGYGYIDDGGSSIVDRRSFGNLWLDIAGTPDDALYATAQNAIDRYDFTVTPGVYTIDLLFTETHLANLETHRVFDVSIQGVTVLDDFDIIKEAGAYNKALMRRIEGVSAEAGLITIRLLASDGSTETDGLNFEHRPEISGIAIWTFDVPARPDAPTPTPVSATPTPTPALPTPTPPFFGGDQPTPTPTFDPLMPTPTPFTLGSGTVDQGTATIELLRTDVELEAVSASILTVTTDADLPVAGFSIAVQLPSEGFDIGTIVVPDRLFAAGFDGRPRMDEERGLLTLTGGLATPLTFQGDAVVSVQLIPRVGAREIVREATVPHVSVQDLADREMTVVIGERAVWRQASVERADVNGDGSIGPADVLLLVGAYGSADGGEWFDARADLNQDGLVDLQDLSILGAGYE